MTHMKVARFPGFKAEELRGFKTCIRNGGMWDG